MEPSPYQDLAFILKNELPSLKGNLTENISNLAKVADFCEDNYLNSSNHDKSRVYEDTKNYAIQAVIIFFYILFLMKIDLYFF
jgi:abl interactor 2